MAFLEQVLEEHFPAGVRPCLLRKPNQDRPRLRIFPERLIDAVWLQAADAVSSNRVFRACRACGKWMELARGTARKSRLFCSAGCRNRYYRDRQDRARAMAAAGQSVREIAQLLQTEREVIKRWITRLED